MTDTTQQAASAAPGVLSQIAAPAADEVDQFQALYDNGAFAPTDAAGKTLPPEEQARLEREAQGETPEAAPEQVQATPEEKDNKDQKQGDEEGLTLEDFYKEHGEAPFLNLRFKTKVDGQETEVPLSELIRDRQLAAASYARMNEAAQARQQLQVEQQKARETLGVQLKQAKELTTLAQNQLLQDFQSINWQQLRANNDPNYSILYTDFQARNAAIQQTLQQIAAAESANAQAADTQRQQAIATERERLFTARPDWRDPVKGQAAYQAITAMGRQLGFTDAELTAITDHRMLIGLHQLSQLSAQAQKQQAAIPKVLKRVRAAPKMAAPGTRTTRDPKTAATQQAREAWMRNPRDEDAGAAYFETLS